MNHPPSAAELQKIADGAAPFGQLSTVSLAKFANRPAPARSWIVPNLIPDRNVTDLAGDGGMGKSLIALQLAVAMSSGTDWLGFVPEPGAVLYLSAEDEVDEIRRRAEVIVAAANGRIRFTDLSDIYLSDLTTAPATELAAIEKSKIALTPLFDSFVETIVAVRPRLVILDTRTDAFAGSEIDRAQVRFFVRALRRTCFKHDTAVLMLSHPSLVGMSSGSGQSGSTGWGNSVRSRLYLERPKADDSSEPDPDLRILTIKKSNYSTTDRTIPLRWNDGVFCLDQFGLSGLDRLAQEQAVEGRFMELLREFELQGRTVNPSGGTNYAPTKFAGADGKIGKKQFQMAQERLFSAGKIRVEPFGPPSRNTKKIVEVTA